MKLRIILLLVVALIGGCSKTGTPPGANPNNPPVNSHKDPKNPKVPNGPVIKNGLVVPKQPINPNCQLKGSYASAVSLTDFTRMQDYLPGAALNMPYNYNSKLDAPVNTEGKFIYENCLDYRNPDSTPAGQINSNGDFSVYLGVGVKNNFSVVESFASNKSEANGGFYQSWIKNQNDPSRDSYLHCDATELELYRSGSLETDSPTCLANKDAYINEAKSVNDTDACYLPFGTENTALGSLNLNADKPGGWKYGFTQAKGFKLDFTDPDGDGDFFDGKLGVMSVGNNKGMGIPLDSAHAFKYHDNNVIVKDEELGKNVLAMRTLTRPAIYENGAAPCNVNPAPSPSETNYGWIVDSTGGFVTTNMFASGAYEIRAKVPKASGLVWAIWTFSGQELDGSRSINNCCGEKYVCDKNTTVENTCTTLAASQDPKNNPVQTDNSCQPFSFDNKLNSKPYAERWVDQSSVPLSCLPQAGKQYINAEIDIEIPSNAPQTFAPPIGAAFDEFLPDYPKRADGKQYAPLCYEKQYKYNTMNMNAYRWTNGGGTGTYQNLWARNNVADFLGDGKYHTYRFEWHTGHGQEGDASYIKPAIDYFFDGRYMGTVDAMVPMVAGRLWAGLWIPDNAETTGVWNGGIPNNGNVAYHGDEPESPISCGEAKTVYEGSNNGATISLCNYATVYVDYVQITPYAESNDTYMPQAFDQPDMGIVSDKTNNKVDCKKNNPPCPYGSTSVIPYYTGAERLVSCGRIKDCSVPDKLRPECDSTMGTLRKL